MPIARGQLTFALASLAMDIELHNQSKKENHSSKPIRSDSLKKDTSILEKTSSLSHTFLGSSSSEDYRNSSSIQLPHSTQKRSRSRLCRFSSPPVSRSSTENPVSLSYPDEPCLSRELSKSLEAGDTQASVVNTVDPHPLSPPPVQKFSLVNRRPPPSPPVAPRPPEEGSFPDREHPSILASSSSLVSSRITVRPRRPAKRMLKDSNPPAHL